PRSRAALSLLPARLRENDRVTRCDELRRNDLRLTFLPLGEQERLARRTCRVPAERPEDGLHLVRVQPVLDRVLVDLPDLLHRRREPLRCRQRVPPVLGRAGALAALRLIRLQALLPERLADAFPPRTAADLVEGALRSPV